LSANRLKFRIINLAIIDPSCSASVEFLNHKLFIPAIPAIRQSFFAAIRAGQMFPHAVGEHAPQLVLQVQQRPSPFYPPAQRSVERCRDARLQSGLFGRWNRQLKTQLQLEPGGLRHFKKAISLT
jgi:hypothetical protein